MFARNSFVMCFAAAAVQEGYAAVTTPANFAHTVPVHFSYAVEPAFQRENTCSRMTPFEDAIKMTAEKYGVPGSGEPVTSLHDALQPKNDDILAANPVCKESEPCLTVKIEPGKINSRKLPVTKFYNDRDSMVWVLEHLVPYKVVSSENTLGNVCVEDLEFLKPNDISEINHRVDTLEENPEDIIIQKYPRINGGIFASRFRLSSMTRFINTDACVSECRILKDYAELVVYRAFEKDRGSFPRKDAYITIFFRRFKKGMDEFLDEIIPNCIENNIGLKETLPVHSDADMAMLQRIVDSFFNTFSVKKKEQNGELYTYQYNSQSDRFDRKLICSS